jgi:hypothetical protein
MQKPLLAVGIAVIGFSMTGADLAACGDKFLVMSRGTRFQRAAVARQPANILVYTNPSSALPKALAKVLQDDILRKAGHRPTTVSDPSQLEQALRQGGWDLVVADLDDSAVMRGQLRGPAAPMIMPVAYNVTGAVVAQAKKDYLRVVKGPVKSQAFLDAVDDALALRQKLQARTTA